MLVLIVRGDNANKNQAVNHYTALNLTKLDVLGGFEKIKVAVAYKDPATGEEMDFFPADLGLLERCEVVVRSIGPLPYLHE